MKLRKTDKRFELHRFGFDCYVEFDSRDWNNYNRYTRYCRANFGSEFWHFNEVMFAPTGKWRAVPHHLNKRRSSKRIYFRGEKYHTLLLMAMPVESKETFHL
jgi:5-keto 4-deoxyuronate isomerase